MPERLFTIWRAYFRKVERPLTERLDASFALLADVIAAGHGVTLDAASTFSLRRTPSDEVAEGDNEERIAAALLGWSRGPGVPESQLTTKQGD